MNLKQSPLTLNQPDVKSCGVNFELPSPEGMSGGLMWRFRKPPDNYIWSTGKIGKIIGIQSAWIGKETLLIEPVQKWASWFYESLETIDEFCG